MNSPRTSVWIGFDTRTALAFAVAKYSLRRFEKYVPVHGLVLRDLRGRGLYTRPTEIRDGRLWDVISEHPMATEFSISRFLAPILAGTGLALFCDSDVLFNASVSRLFEIPDGRKAVYCVKHDHQPAETKKMDDQVQSQYSRKNWSSVMLFDCDHPANKRLTLDMVNTLPGRDLHRFCWLEDDEIGSLPVGWNFLVGHDKVPDDYAPSLLHFTNGLPSMEGYEDQDYADLWWLMVPAAVGAL